MSYLDYRMTASPTGLRKVLYVNWPLVVLLTAVASVGFLMLYSVGRGDVDTWARPQMIRFGIGMILMFIAGFIPIWFWRSMSAIAYVAALVLLVAVELFGEVGMGAQRWIDLGPVRLQPSELMKVALVMMLAAYYDWLDLDRKSRLVWVLIPVALILIPTTLVLKQPDLGTAVLLIAGGGIVMFAAGVSLWYFGGVIALGTALITLVMQSRGTDWQLLKDYQFKRIDTFLDPAADPLGDGYNIMQAQIALGSGGWTGKGFMQGTQARLNFLPEKHTDFIFTTLAEEFGFIGSVTLLALYAMILGFCLYAALINRDRYSSLLTIGISATFFLFFFVNMAMVMGLMPVVGVPLPLVSYGGTQMMILLMAFGLIQSAHIHRPR